MKLFLLMEVIFICLIQPAFSQENFNQLNNDSTRLLLNHQPRFFINIHTGYAAGLGSTFKFYPDDVTSVSVEKINNEPPAVTTSYKSTTKGLGEGFRYGAGLSYIVNDFINIGFDFDYFRSTISRTRDSSFHKITNNSEYTYNSHSTISYDATLLTFSPEITFKAISKPKFYIYNKIGAVITYRPNSIQKNVVQQQMHFGKDAGTDSTAVSYTRYEWGIKKPAFGFMGSVGGQVKLSDKIRAFAEVQFSHIVFVVRNRVLTDYMVNGNNLISTVPESEKLIEFRDSYSVVQQSPDPTQPSVTVVQRIPITYVGIQAGLAYRF